MRKSLFYVLFLLACLVGQSAEAKVKQKPVYLFGFATSFVDSLAYVTDVQYMDSSWAAYKNGIIVYEMTLSWTGKNKVIFLDADTFETKSVKINSDLEAKNEIRVTYDGNYLITDSSDLEKNMFSKHIYSVEDNREIENIDFTKCNDCMIYMSSMVSTKVKSLIFFSEYKSGRYEMYKYCIK